MSTEPETRFHYTLSELCRVCQLEQSWVIELIEYEVIHADTGADTVFDQQQVAQIMKAQRLQHDLGLNTSGVALAMQLLEQIAEQQKELDLLRRLNRLG